MHVHILGIAGTFMGGVAAIARAGGHRVTGSDRNIYPPMSTQLEAFGIEIVQGYEPGQLSPAPDIVVVGNVMTRGVPVIEALLSSGIAYTSGPEWLAANVLRGRSVLAVAGTHGKTSTTSMLAWMLERAGLEPGFLIGGVPPNFGVSARLGRAPFFVIEADEYDTAFFDKRAKFVHYRPRTALLNNLEFDHADIYPDIESIERMFHQLVRTVPADGLIVAHASDQHLRRALALGCWTPVEGFSRTAVAGARWTVDATDGGDFSEFRVLEDGTPRATVRWSMFGAHNAENALAAIACARHAGVPIEKAAAALETFQGIKRRMEMIGQVGGVTVYDDFAHHPSAIATTIDGLRRRVGKARIVAVLEPRSNTMKMGVHRETLGASLAGADAIWLYEPPGLGWTIADSTRSLGSRARIVNDIEGLATALTAGAKPGDHIVIMSNGGFGGLHRRLLDGLAKSAAAVS
ncbi:MAG TPA: UDP-N-acetylmuramate:L-alanyl-gamma-D-glutamyl-meso-diaminopimelate ligase [Steroidobacteraceae bacterium]|nr:UDP-N-acetylmuramate:L-alanyl-gamma-D-glutamyl-meso-diaminopimelate ligase [Steroidobacteraceae bacterium]